MKSYVKKMLVVFIVALVSISLSSFLYAQDNPKDYFAKTDAVKADPNWPERSITVMVPFSPGGANDIMAARYNPYLKKELEENIKTK